MPVLSSRRPLKRSPVLCHPGIASAFLLLATLSVAPPPATAQPVLGVPVVNTPCASGPTLVEGQPDTVASVPDAEGFYSLFDGKSLKGWWENCLTGHSSQDRTLGGLWIADSTHGALYSQQASTLAGSVLMTNKSWEHYELIFDFWPTWGNDAGVFNRVVPTGSNAGRTYQTGLDYKHGSSIGGSYGEGGYGNFNIDPYLFTREFGVVTVSTWSAFTAARNPTSFGCPASGCGVAQWHAVWDTAGWNQVRVKFFGGLTGGSPTRMQAWIRRLNNPPVAPPDNWVPTHDSAMNILAPANPIGLQIHGGADYWNRAGRGTWYRNIRIRPLDVHGEPIPVSLHGEALRSPAGGLKLSGDALTGRFDGAHTIRVRDARGRELRRFSSSSAGEVRYELGDVRGLLLIDVRTARGWTHFRLVKP
jgi:hypothetical protein